MLKKVGLSFLLAQSYLLATTTLAPSRLEVKDGVNMYIEGQFLWWLSKNDNLYFCQQGPLNSPFVPTPTFKGQQSQLDTSFTPGGRLTFGGLMAYDYWDLHFTWTYFTQKSHSNNMNQSYYIGNSFGYASLADYVKAKYNITLNMLDAIMTRPSWMGERFSLAPYFGARGTWLDQVFKTKAGISSTNNTTFDRDVYNRSRSDFRGAGLLAGFQIRYELKGGWCIEGNFLGSGVYGNFVNYFSGYIKPRSDASFTQADRLIFVQDSRQSMLVDFEYRLGIAYNKFLNQGRYHLGGGISWEEVIFLNGNRLPIYANTLGNGIEAGLVNSNPSNLLTLQGITVRFVFGF